MGVTVKLIQHRIDVKFDIEINIIEIDVKIKTEIGNFSLKVHILHWNMLIEYW